MSDELKPCPFCGDVPELSIGDGTQYEVECVGCGQAMASVQICDLMTLDERANETFTNYRYGEQFVELAKLKAIENWNTRAQLPSQGGEAVEVVACREVWTDPDNGVGPTVIAENQPGCRHKFWAQGMTVVTDDLMTVAQHQRILAAANHPADQVAEGVVVSREQIKSWVTGLQCGVISQHRVFEELRALMEVKGE